MPWLHLKALRFPKTSDLRSIPGVGFPLHRFKRILLVVMVWIHVVLGVTDLCQASKKIRTPTRDELLGTWVGLSEDERYVFRFTLTSNGEGRGAYSFLEEDPRVFRITSWAYEPPTLTIIAEPAMGTQLTFERLRGTVIGFAMQLTMSGEGWKRSLTLRREEDLIERWSKVKEVMGLMPQEPLPP